MATIKQIMRIAGAEAGANAEKLAAGMGGDERREFLKGILERLREDMLTALVPRPDWVSRGVAGPIDPAEIQF